MCEVKPLLVLWLSISLSACAAKTPNADYRPLPERDYAVEGDVALEAVMGTFQALGFVIGSVGGIGDRTIVTTTEMPSEQGEDDGLECRSQWKGLARGGWVDDVGGVVLTANVTVRDEGTSIALTESGVGGCVPTGYWGERFFELMDAKLDN